MLHLKPTFQRGKLLDKPGHGFTLCIAVELGILLAYIKGRTLFHMRKLEERQEALESAIEAITVVFVVKDKGRHTDIKGGREGKVMPLNVSEELGVAGDPLKSPRELGVGPSGLHQFVGRINAGTPRLETKFIIGVGGKPGGVADSGMALLLQMESSHNVVKRRANDMNCFLHNVGGITNLLKPDSSR